MPGALPGDCALASLPLPAVGVTAPDLAYTHATNTEKSDNRKRCHVCFAGQFLLCHVTKLGDAQCNMTANHCHSTSVCLYEQHHDMGHREM